MSNNLNIKDGGDAHLKLLSSDFLGNFEVMKLMNDSYRHSFLHNVIHIPPPDIIKKHLKDFKIK